jgi:hypothetical protein
MKRKITITTLFILAIIALIFTIGLILPKQREFVKTAEFKSSPQNVFQLVTDFQSQKNWRSDVQEIKVIDQNTWTEIPQKGTPITFKTKKKVENQIFEIEIIEPKNFNGYWIGTFEQTSKGTKVVFKEVILIENPFYRVLSSMFVDLDKTMEIYMSNLKTKLGE